MMDELKLIIEAIAGLPTVMVWVLAGYLVYKLAIVGSVYGLIRFCVEKVHDAYTKRHESIELRGTIDGVCITSDGTHQHLIAQIYRLKGKGLNINSHYIHREGVDWLKAAIDAKEQSEAKK